MSVKRILYSEDSRNAEAVVKSPLSKNYDKKKESMDYCFS